MTVANKADTAPGTASILLITKLVTVFSAKTKHVDAATNITLDSPLRYTILTLLNILRYCFHISLLSREPPGHFQDCTSCTHDPHPPSNLRSPELRPARVQHLNQHGRVSVRFYSSSAGRTLIVIERSLVSCSFTVVVWSLL